MLWDSQTSQLSTCTQGLQDSLPSDYVPEFDPQLDGCALDSIPGQLDPDTLDPSAEPDYAGPEVATLAAAPDEVQARMEPTVDHSQGSWLPVANLKEFFGIEPKSLEKAILFHGFEKADVQNRDGQNHVWVSDVIVDFLAPKCTSLLMPN